MLISLFWWWNISTVVNLMCEDKHDRKRDELASIAIYFVFWPMLLGLRLKYLSDIIETGNKNK